MNKTAFDISNLQVYNYKRNHRGGTDMHNSAHISKAKRCFALLLAVVIAVVFAVSVLFVVSRAEHECSGSDDCQVCQLVSNSLNVFRNISPDPNGTAITMSVCFALVLALGTVFACAASKNLITLKVKLSN